MAPPPCKAHSVVAPATSGDKKHAPVIFSLGLLFLITDQFLQLTPPLRAQALSAAQEAFRSGRYDLAIEHLKVAAADPHEGVQVEAQMNMSTACLALGRTREAVAAAKAAVKLSPAFVPALLALARAHMARRDWSKAKRRLRQALEVEPKNEACHQALGASLAAIARRTDKRARVALSVVLVLCFGMLGGCCAIALMAAADDGDPPPPQRVAGGAPGWRGHVAE